MGSGGRAVKSTDVEMPPFGLDSLSEKLRHTLESCEYFRVFKYLMVRSAKARKRKRTSAARQRPVPADMPPPEEPSPDHAAAFMAEMLAGADGTAPPARRAHLVIVDGAARGGGASAAAEQGRLS